MLRVLSWPVRLAATVTGVAASAGWRVGRIVGGRRLVLLAAGVVAGLVLAPVPGRDVRSRLRRAWSARPRGPAARADLADRVREALSSAQRTWHLPQPEVEVTGRVVVLRGEVPHETARRDLERAAASVPGVTGVDNRLALAGTSPPRSDVEAT